MAGSVLRWLIFLLAVTAQGAVAATAGTVRVEQHTNGRYLGAMNCSSSSCHGGAGEQHNQFIVWSNRDFHQRASLILTNARSARMAETLGIRSPGADARCTVCHSPMTSIAPGRIVGKNRPDNGVSCESCHGPAEAWLRSHTRHDYTYAMRVSSGMRDLRSFYVRANTCVACHQTLDTDIVAAGHPPLVFEFQAQMRAEPPHWRDSSDSPVRSWLIGQAVALRELSWKVNAGGVKQDNDAVAQIDALAWLLDKVTASDRSLPSIASNAQSGALQHAADDLARRASVRTFDNDYGKHLLQILSASSAEFSQLSPIAAEALFYRAKRLALTCEALSQTASRPQERSAEFSRVMEDVVSPTKFNASAFAEHMAAWRAAAGNERRD